MTQPNSKTPIGELYNFYLKPGHLPSGGCNVIIAGVEVKELHPRPTETEQKLVLSFKNATRKMIVNQTQAARLVDLFGEDYTTWVGQTVHLSAVAFTKSQQTILVGPARNGTK